MLRHVSALPWSPIGAEWFVFNISASMAGSIAGGPPLALPRRLKRFDIRRPTPFIFAFILARLRSCEEEDSVSRLKALIGENLLF